MGNNIKLRQIIQEETLRYLEEIKIKDLKQKYPEKAQLIDRLSQIIPNKYLQFAMEKEETEEMTDIIEVIKQFDKYLSTKRLDATIKAGEYPEEIKNINHWLGKPMGILKNMLTVASEVETRADKTKRTEGDADIIYESPRWVAYVPKTKAASCAIGTGTHWCTSTTSEKNLYNRYVRSGEFLVYVIDKKETKTVNGKIAIHLDHDGTILDFFDKKDGNPELGDLKEIWKGETNKIIAAAKSYEPTFLAKYSEKYKFKSVVNKRLINAPEAITLKNSNGNSPMALMAYNGVKGIVDSKLLTTDNLPILKDELGETPLHYLARFYADTGPKDEEFEKKLVNHKLATVGNNHGNTVIHELAERGISAFKYREGSERIENEYGETPELLYQRVSKKNNREELQEVIREETLRYLEEIKTKDPSH